MPTSQNPDGPAPAGSYPELDELERDWEAARQAAVAAETRSAQAPPGNDADAQESTGDGEGGDSDEGQDDDTEEPEAPDGEAGDEGEQPEGDEKPPEGDDGKQGRPSRRDAARLREQLKAEQEARQLAEQARETLGKAVEDRTAKDAEIMRLVQEAALTDAELDVLTTRGLNGDQEAATKAAEARAFRMMVSPVYEHARKVHLSRFLSDLDQAKTLSGMTTERWKQVQDSPTANAMLKVAHDAGREVGLAESKKQIAALQAEIRNLKTRQASSATQPLVGPGKNPGAAGRFKLDPDGLLSEEAIQAAKRGEYADIR